MPIALTIAAIALYLLATALVVVRLLRTAKGADTAKALGLVPWLAALAMHAPVLYAHMTAPGGINLGFFNALSLATWLAAVLLFLGALARPVDNLGVVILPFAAVAVGLQSWFHSRALVEASTRWALDVHVVISLLAYSLLTLGAVQAMVLAVQEHQLHSRHPSRFIRALPPLQTMESLLFQLIGAGFVLLTLALFTGVLFLEDIFAQHLVHKTALSILAWVVFAVLLVGRWRAGWRGRTAVRWTLGGFAALVLAYFGSKLVLELVLGR